MPGDEGCSAAAAGALSKGDEDDEDDEDDDDAFFTTTTNDNKKKSGCPAPLGAIEVIGAGLGRTGTKSLQAALGLLGYRTYHFPPPHHAAAWAEHAEGRRPLSDVLSMIAAEGFTATCDNPCCDVYLEQLRAFPSARVVLTVRSSASAWASSWATLMRFVAAQERPFSLAYPSFVQWIPFMRAWRRMRSLIGGHLGLAPGGPRSRTRTRGSPRSTRHTTRRWLRACRRTACWSSTCATGGRRSAASSAGRRPRACRFPRVNESADIAQVVARVLDAVAYAWLPCCCALAAAARHLASTWRR